MGPDRKLPPGVDEKNVIKTGGIAIVLDSQSPSDPAALSGFGKALMAPSIPVLTAGQLLMSKVK